MSPRHDFAVIFFRLMGSPATACCKAVSPGAARAALAAVLARRREHSSRRRSNHTRLISESMATGVSGQAARSCRLGGRVMPAACKMLPTWPAGGAGGDALPSFSMVASWRRSRSRSRSPHPTNQGRGGTHQKPFKLTAKSWRGDRDPACSVQ